MPPIPVILTSPTDEEYTFISYSSAARFLDGKGVECNHDALKRCIVKIKPIQGWNIKHGTSITTTNAMDPFLYVFGEDASDIFQGKSVRVTSGTPKQVSIIDIINVVCRVGQPHKVYNRIVEQHSSILELVQKHKFDGPGQKPTPVTDARGLITIIQHLPGENADRFRSGASDILVRFLGGDTTLADADNEIMMQHEKNVMDHKVEMMNINKEIALKKYDTELKKIDTELAVKKYDNELAMKNIEARMQIATLVLNNNPNLINESVLAVLLGIHT